MPTRQCYVVVSGAFWILPHPHPYATVTSQSRLRGWREVSMVFSSVHIVITLLYLAIPALILYWIVRLAVRHEMRKSRK